LDALANRQGPLALVPITLTNCLKRARVIVAYSRAILFALLIKKPKSKGVSRGIMSVLSASAITRAKRVFEFNKRVIDEKGSLPNLVPGVNEVFTVVDGKIVIQIDDAELSKQNEISNVITAVMNDLLYFINVNEIFLDDASDYGLDINILEILTILYSKATEREASEIVKLKIKLPNLDYFLKKIKDFQASDENTQLRKIHKQYQDGMLKELKEKLERSEVTIKDKYNAQRKKYEKKISELENQGKILQEQLDSQQKKGQQMLQANKKRVNQVVSEKIQLEGEIAQFKMTIDQLMSDAGEKSDLENRIQELQGRIDEDQALITGATQERDDYLKGLDAIKTEKEELEQQRNQTIEKLNDITKQRDKQISYKQEQVASLQEQISLLKEINQTLVKDKEDLQQPLKEAIEGEMKGDFQLIAIDLDNIVKSQIERDRHARREQRAIFDVEAFFKRIYDILHADHDNVNLYKVLGLIFHSEQNAKYESIMKNSKNTKLVAFASIFKWVQSRFTKIGENGIRRNQDTDTYTAAQTSTKIATYREKIQNFYLVSGDKDMIPILDTINELDLDIPVKVIAVKETLAEDLRKEIIKRAISDPENKIYYI